jgi:hypothetical protein
MAKRKKGPPATATTAGGQRTPAATAASAAGPMMRKRPHDPLVGCSTPPAPPPLLVHHQQQKKGKAAANPHTMQGVQPSLRPTAAPDAAAAEAGEGPEKTRLELIDEQLALLRANALADTSQKTADTAERSFVGFMNELDIRIGPEGITDQDLGRYIAYLSMRPTITAFGTIKNYVSMGVRRWHQQRGLPWTDTSDRYSVNAALTGARRIMSDAPSQQKLPITVDLLSEIRKQLNIGKSEDACLLAAFTVSFYCLLRKGNVVADRMMGARKGSDGKAKKTKGLQQPLLPSAIRRKDVRVDADGQMWIRLHRTKTIQFGERVLDLPVPNIAGSPINPRQALVYFMQMTADRPADEQLFGYRNSKGEWTPLAYAPYLARLKTLLKKVGVDPARYAGHSFRRGGATFAHESGISPLVIKALGDWLSDTFMRYCEIQRDMRVKAAASLAEGTLAAHGRHAASAAAAAASAATKAAGGGAAR